MDAGPPIVKHDAAYSLPGHLGNTVLKKTALSCAALSGDMSFHRLYLQVEILSLR